MNNLGIAVDYNEFPKSVWYINDRNDNLSYSITSNNLVSFKNLSKSDTNILSCFISKTNIYIRRGIN